MHNTLPGCNFKNKNSLLTFVHIEKTGGETIKWILRSSFGVSHCDVSSENIFRPLHPNQLRHIQFIHPSLNSIAGHPVTPYMQLEQASLLPLQYFTFLREPLNQCASYFNYLAVTLNLIPTSQFIDWIQTEWPRNMQTKRICGEACAKKAIRMIEEKNIFVGLTERFDESIFLMQHLMCPDLKPGYKRRNIAPDHRISRELLTNKQTYALLAEAVSEDRKLYEWVRSRLYPRYISIYQTQTSKPVPVSFPYTQQGYRKSYVFANRIYRNLIFKPLERFHIRH